MKNMNGKYNSTFRLRKGIWADAGEPLLFASVDVTDCKSMLNGGGIWSRIFMTLTARRRLRPGLS